MKSPVASLTLTCSSVKKRVRVTMLVLMVSASLPEPLDVNCADIVVDGTAEERHESTGQETSDYQADCLRAEQNGAMKWSREE